MARESFVNKSCIFKWLANSGHLLANKSEGADKIVQNSPAYRISIPHGTNNMKRLYSIYRIYANAKTKRCATKWEDKTS